MMPGANSIALDYVILPVCRARDQRYFESTDINGDVGAGERNADALPDAVFANGVE